jgi:hypothetical protein
MFFLLFMKSKKKSFGIRDWDSNQSSTKPCMLSHELYVPQSPHLQNGITNEASPTWLLGGVSNKMM